MSTVFFASGGQRKLWPNFRFFLEKPSNYEQRLSRRMPFPVYFKSWSSEAWEFNELFCHGNGERIF